MLTPTASTDGGLFLVFNAHATLVAQGRPISRDVHTAFDHFIESWGELPNENPTSVLAFWKALKEQE